MMKKIVFKIALFAMMIANFCNANVIQYYNENIKINESLHQAAEFEKIREELVNLIFVQMDPDSKKKGKVIWAAPSMERSNWGNLEIMYKPALDELLALILEFSCLELTWDPRAKLLASVYTEAIAIFAYKKRIDVDEQCLRNIEFFDLLRRGHAEIDDTSQALEFHTLQIEWHWQRNQSKRIASSIKRRANREYDDQKNNRAVKKNKGC